MNSKDPFHDFAAGLRELMQVSLKREAYLAPVELFDKESDGLFNRLALELFALQFEHNVAYRKTCEYRGGYPLRTEHWTQIPVIPTSSFKELELSSLSRQERTAVFHSSGTTEQLPSRHFHSSTSLQLYELSLLSWCRMQLFGNEGTMPARCDTAFPVGYERARTGLRLISLTPPKTAAPHSSLVHMFDAFAHTPEIAVSEFVGTIANDGSWKLDWRAARACLEQAVLANEPVLLVGTAFSFVHLLDNLSEHPVRLKLPEGSRVLETGGYKGRSRSMPREQLHSLLNDWLGVPFKQIVCEYGMAELSSQAYGVNPGPHFNQPVSHIFCFPPWARVQIISPETGCEVAEGGTGLIRVFDLANVYSVMAIQTEDLAIRRGLGFELVGRANQAEPRGCSLLAIS